MAKTPPAPTAADDHSEGDVDLGLRKSPDRLQRKGKETRQRLMAATRDLLVESSPVGLTSAAIARAAGTSAATFYVYFEDVTSVILALCEDASADAENVFAALSDWKAHGDADRGASDFIDAYLLYWEGHRTVLNIRNMEADRGDERFRKIRLAFGNQVIKLLVAIASQARPTQNIPPTRNEIYALTVVLFAAIDRLAAVQSIYQPDEMENFRAKLIRNAQVRLLKELAGVAPD